MESISKQEYMRVLSELDYIHGIRAWKSNATRGPTTRDCRKSSTIWRAITTGSPTWGYYIVITRKTSGAQNSPREPKISLPTKFDGTRSRFRGFLNQVRLVIQLHPNRYPTDVARVGLVGTFLRRTTLAWFAPLLEKKSPLLEDFEAFVMEFQASFGDTDNTRTTINKIRSLRQGDRPASA